jgi:putative membrane protein insertion efficiency factor
VQSPALAVSSSDTPKPGLFARLLILFVRLYQLTLGHLLGGHCRFQPSCSNYALEVLRTHGAFRGALRSAARVSRCHPFHPGGYDPPPPPPPAADR